jgi:hypothetical protein
MEPHTDFDYEQVDADLGWHEPNIPDEAIGAFERITEWVFRPVSAGRPSADGSASGSEPPTTAVIHRRIDVVTWLLRPSREAGCTLESIARSHGVGVGVLKQDVARFRRHVDVLGPIKRKRNKEES